MFPRSLGPAFSISRRCRPLSHFFSTLVTMEESTGGAYAILRLNRPPVNSLNLDLLRALSNAITECEGNADIHGIILASSNPKIFSAGLDIMEMYQPDAARLRTFWTALQDLYLQLYVTPLVAIAAVEGHSPAGGCLLAMTCDYRIMTKEGNPKMGLNETRLGIVAPTWFQQTLINTIGHRQAELMLNLGLQYDAEKALGLDLIDACVDAVDEVMPAAEQTITQWLKIPGSIL